MWTSNHPSPEKFPALSGHRVDLLQHDTPSITTSTLNAFMYLFLSLFPFQSASSSSSLLLLFFFHLSAAPSLSICVFPSSPPCKNIPQIEESPLSLIHLLCNPSFISSSCKPLGKPLLLCSFCSETANLLFRSKNILLIFVLFPPPKNISFALFFPLISFVKQS